LAIDDVAEQFPAGQMLAIRLSGTMRKPGNIAIVSSADKMLYEELTGIPATPIFQPLAEDPRFRIGTPAECRNVQPQAFVLSLAFNLCCLPGNSLPVLSGVSR
jgi:hypothetical protein